MQSDWSVDTINTHWTEIFHLFGSRSLRLKLIDTGHKKTSHHSPAPPSLPRSLGLELTENFNEVEQSPYRVQENNFTLWAHEKLNNGVVD